jgi:hypothetical protein
VYLVFVLSAEIVADPVLTVSVFQLTPALLEYNTDAPVIALGKVIFRVAVVLAVLPKDTVGAATGATGVAEAEAADEALTPTTLVAVTVKVYAVPLVKPVTTQVSAEALTQLFEPTEEETV